MMRKRTNRKQATRRKGARGRAKPRARREISYGSSVEMGNYDPNRGEATS